MKQDTITITVNGRSEPLVAAVSVRGYLKNRNMNPDAVVVEHNREILDKKAYDTTLLAHGDSMEILQFVGGG